MSSPSRYPVPAGRARAEILVVNSRFIADAAPTPDVDSAKAFIAETRAAMPDASHHCYAFLVGYGASLTAGMSDDGEPSGTAGRPMLAVLRGADLGDVTVVVTRYFGGTLLGTGGLVRAYGDAVRAVLELLPRGERVELRSMLVSASYSDYALVKRALEARGATIEAEDFAADVSIVAALPAEDHEPCAAELAELTAGRAQVVMS